MLAADDVAVVSLETPSVIDSQFQLALRMIETGQAAAAVPLLEKLWSKTEAPRIRLELARALWILGRDEEARALFVLAFKADPPPVAKATILNIIDLIDRRRGKLTFSVGFARFENPLQQPGSYTLNFAGIELSYVPDKAYRNLAGVTVGGTYLKAWSDGWKLNVDASYRDLKGTAADRFAGNVSFSRRVGASPLEMKIGATRLTQQSQSFTLPYVQFSYDVPLGRKSSLRPAVTVGYFVADLGRSVSGMQADIFLPVVYTPVMTKFFAVGPTVLRRSAGYGEMAYTSVGVRALGTLQTTVLNAEAGIQGTVTHFDAVDPFWGVRRKDKGLFLSAMLSSYKLRLGPFVPAVGVTCNLTRSTVSYYRQSGCDTQFEVRKIF